DRFHGCSAGLVCTNYTYFRGHTEGGGRLPRSSAPTPLELTQMVDERAHARHRHRVVDRGTHAADDAVALERDQPGLARAGEEVGVERRIGEMERDVHQRAVGGDDTRPVEAARVEAAVEELSLRA